MTTLGEYIWAQAARDAVIAKWWFHFKVVLAVLAFAALIKYLVS